MSSSTHDGRAGVPVTVDRAGVLRALRAGGEAVQAAEVAVLRTTVDWAMLHASWDWDQADHSIFEDELVPLAGPGAPLISADCVAEFAAVAGLSPQTGRARLAVAVELRYRLRRLYERAVAGEVPVWRARWIAERTLHLTQTAADAVDRLLAPYAGSVTFAQMDRTIAEAIARHDPDAARKREEQAVEQTGVWFHHPDPTLESQAIASLDARLDATDALDLDAAVTAGAQALADLGSTESLDVRRAAALADLARADLTITYPTTTDDDAAEVEARVAKAVSRHQRKRHVTLVVHLSNAAVTGTTTVGLGRVDNQQLIVTAEQIRAWCGRPDTVVTVRPVIDLNHAERIDGYHVPDRFRDHITLRDGRCVFPHCSRRAGLDADHIVAHADGGPTDTTNLAPLCRTHHILKTRSAWTYRPIRPGHYLWTSPHGWTFLVDPTGTYPLTQPRPRARPRRDADRGQSGDRASPRPPPT